MSTEPGRVTLVGEQVLASYPDSGQGRVTLAGEQVLAEAPLTPARVSTGLLEILVGGAFIPPGRVTLAGEQVLASTQPPLLRVSTSLIEVLVGGAFIPAGRVTLAGEQVLASTPGVPLRVSTSLIELLVGNDYSFAPGKVHGASLTTSHNRAYLSPDAPQSAVEVSHLSESLASPATYDQQGSFGRAAQVQLSASVPSAILDFEPAARLYAQRLSATVSVQDLPDPAVPQSDLDVSHVSQAAGATVDYPDKGVIQSLGRAHAFSLASTIEVAGLPVPSAPQSDLDVSHVSETAAITSDVNPEGSNLWVTSIDQRAAAASTPAPEGSDLWVSQLSEAAAVVSEYPESYPALVQLHGARLQATTPAGWLDEYVTQVRLHSVKLQTTSVARDGVYIHPALVRPSVEVSYLTNCVGYASEQALGGGSAALVSYLSEQAALRAYYGDTDAPQSTVTATELFVEVVRADPSFTAGAGAGSPVVPNVSVQLIYEGDD